MNIGYWKETYINKFKNYLLKAEAKTLDLSELENIIKDVSVVLAMLLEESVEKEKEI